MQGLTYNVRLDLQCCFAFCTIAGAESTPRREETASVEQVSSLHLLSERIALAITYCTSLVSSGEGCCKLGCCCSPLLINSMQTYE
jgi:hypothetical protein